MGEPQVSERICARPGCGEPMAGKRAGSRYHSDSCRARASREARRRDETKRTVSDRRLDRVPLTWDPPSEPRGPYRTSEPCPRCGRPLIAEPRGIWRACGTCGRMVTPAGISDPYAAGTARQRQVRSQRERDLEAIGLARRKGVMLAQLGALAADARLDPAALPVVDWFRDQVKNAGSDGRLDELAGLLPESGIRRRRWWQGAPAAIEAPDGAGYDGEDQDQDQDQDSGEGACPRAVASAPPVAPVIDLAAELAARGYQIQADAPGGRCRIVEQHTGGCALAAPRVVGGVRVCDGHWHALTASSRQRPAS